jgi:polysaccharide chain length determinant protein (PEP-CTERM system associated)
MVRNGDVTLADVKRVARRYWWILALTTASLAAAGYIGTVVLPKKFTSSTMVLVEQPTVPSEYVKPVVTDDLYHRLASMKEQSLSRSRLEPIIEKLNLYPERRGKDHMEDLVERLRKAIEVELIQPMLGSVNRQPPGFHVSVTFADAQLAQQICTEITSMFMEQNARSREKQGEETTQFLTQHLGEAKAKLDEQDAKLAQFKRENLGRLPEEEQSNLSLLTGMNTQLDAATQALNRAQQDKAFNETMLNQQQASWKATQNGQQNPESQEQQLDALQDQLTTLLSRYTPEHPDVIKVRAQIENLKRKIAEEPATKSPASNPQASVHEPPAIQQLHARIKQDEMSITELTRRQSQIQEQIRVLQGRVQASPMVEQQYKELTRDYQTALEFYNDLLKKRESSAMATSLEHQQESETFRVLDAPSLPVSPSFPNKLYFLGGGFGGGLALGIGILGLLAYNDKSLHSERDAETTLRLPVLALIPAIDPSSVRDKSPITLGASR